MLRQYRTIKSYLTRKKGSGQVATLEIHRAPVPSDVPAINFLQSHLQRMLLKRIKARIMKRGML